MDEVELLPAPPVHAVYILVDAVGLHLYSTEFQGDDHITGVFYTGSWCDRMVWSMKLGSYIKPETRRPPRQSLCVRHSWTQRRFHLNPSLFMENRGEKWWLGTHWWNFMKKLLNLHERLWEMCFCHRDIIWWNWVLLASCSWLYSFQIRGDVRTSAVEHGYVKYKQHGKTFTEGGDTVSSLALYVSSIGWFLIPAERNSVL